MNAASAPMRALFGLLLSVLLGLRLLSPAGFMPAFEHGTVAIIACPDAEAPPSAGMVHHQHGGHGKFHVPCPYAAAAAPATDVEPFAILAALMLFGAVPLFGRAFRFLERHRSRDRPPLRGPPIPA